MYVHMSRHVAMYHVICTFQVSSSPPPAVPKYPLLPAIEAMPSEATPLRLSRMEKPPSLGYPESDPNGSGYGYYGYGRQHSLGSESGGGSSMDSLNVFMTQVRGRG